MLTPSSVSACTAGVSPAQSHSASPLPPVRGFPALRVPYGRVRLPSSLRLPLRRFPIGWPTQPSKQLRRRWISQVPDASVSGRAVLLDPAAVSGSHRLLRLPTIAFQNYDSVGLRMTTLRGSIASLLVTACPSLCLRLAHVVTSISPRLDSRWGGLPLAGAGFSPAGSARLSWRTVNRIEHFHYGTLYDLVFQCSHGDFILHLTQ